MAPTHDAKTLDDAAVADLLEGAPATETAIALDSKSDTPVVQQLADNATLAAIAECFGWNQHRLKDAVARSRRALALAGTALALLLSIALGFVSVAAKAPALAKVLFFVFVVLVPFAVTRVLRERRGAVAPRHDGPPAQ